MNRKAQSAIEYLTTYGWMLLVVSVVSTVAYSLVDPGCQEGVSGYIGQEPSIDQFGTGQDFLGLGLGNRRSETLYIEEIAVTDTETGENRTVVVDTVISPGGLNQTSIPMAEGRCNTYDFSVNYSISTLPDQYSSGRMTVEGDLIDVAPPPALQSFTASY